MCRVLNKLVCAPLACHGDLLLWLAGATRDERIAWWRGLAAPRRLECS